jgi:CMP-N-acetylneuraminic acid synthetase
MAAVVALLPFRRHSERVANKNFRYLAGKPLWCHTLSALLRSRTVHHVVIDTDADVAEMEREIRERFDEHEAQRVTVLERTAGLRGDLVPMTEVLRNCCARVLQLRGQTSEDVTFLQTHTTNPLLASATIDAAVSHFHVNYPVFCGAHARWTNAAIAISG